MTGLAIKQYNVAPIVFLDHHASLEFEIRDTGVLQALDRARRIIGRIGIVECRYDYPVGHVSLLLNGIRDGCLRVERNRLPQSSRIGRRRTQRAYSKGGIALMTSFVAPARTNLPSLCFNWLTGMATSCLPTPRNPPAPMMA